MKAAKALDVSGDGIIDEQEFLRLLDPAVLAAAEPKAAGGAASGAAGAKLEEEAAELELALEVAQGAQGVEVAEGAQGGGAQGGYSPADLEALKERDLSHGNPDHPPPRYVERLARQVKERKEGRKGGKKE